MCVCARLYTVLICVGRNRSDITSSGLKRTSHAKRIFLPIRQWRRARVRRLHPRYARAPALHCLPAVCNNDDAAYRELHFAMPLTDHSIAKNCLKLLAVERQIRDFPRDGTPSTEVEDPRVICQTNRIVMSRSTLTSKSLSYWEFKQRKPDFVVLTAH